MAFCIASFRAACSSANPDDAATRCSSSCSRFGLMCTVTWVGLGVTCLGMVELPSVTFQDDGKGRSTVGPPRSGVSRGVTTMPLFVPEPRAHRDIDRQLRQL